MKKRFIISALAILGIGGIAISAYVAVVLVLNFWPTDRTLAKDLPVSADWTEIIDDSGFTAKYRDQSVNLRIPGIDPDSRFDGIKRSDGSMINVEIELFDESGAVYPLELSGYVTKFHRDAVFRGQLPKNRRFVKVRVRSDVPFTCSEVYWRDYNPE